MGRTGSGFGRVFDHLALTHLARAPVPAWRSEGLIVRRRNGKLPILSLLMSPSFHKRDYNCSRIN